MPLRVMAKILSFPWSDRCSDYRLVHRACDFVRRVRGFVPYGRHLYLGGARLCLCWDRHDCRRAF